jgi:hypothetical protein
MKALIIASLLFFGLRAMSAEVGEDQKSECAFTNQSAKRETKQVDSNESKEEKKEASSTISK